MKKIFIICVMITIATMLFAETVIDGGNVSGTWNSEGSPYIIQGDIRVLPDEILKIERGVSILFDSGTRLIVQGELKAYGTKDNRIEFTAFNRSWGGIEIVDTNNIFLEYIDISNVLDNPAISIINSENVSIVESMFYDNNCLNLLGSESAIALFINNSHNINIEGNEFYNNNIFDNSRCYPVVGIYDFIDVYFNSNLLYENNASSSFYMNTYEQNEIGETTFNNNKIFQNNTLLTNIDINNYSSSILFIEDNLIFDNICNSSEYDTRSSGITLCGHNFQFLRNTIFRNRTNGLGGGLAIYPTTGGIIYITNNEIKENEATWGGGIYVHEKSGTLIFIEYNNISKNKANHGGGVYIKESYKIELDYNIITFNTASCMVCEFNIGGGIFLIESIADISNCILSLNTGEGLFLNEASANIYNSIFWDNYSENNYQINANVDATANTIIYNCVVQNGEQGINLTPPYDLSNIYNINPQFVDKYTYNFHTATDFNGMGYGAVNVISELPDYIGLYPYDESTAVSVHNRTLRAGWNWVSFPKLPRDAETDEAVSFLTVASTVNPYGLTFTYKLNDAYYDNNFWYNQLENIKSSLGYKVEMSQNMQHSIEGTTLNPNTMISLYANQENWIGYFLPETIRLEEAFGEDVIENITMIKTKYGAVFSSFDDPLGPVLQKSISFGDMVVVTVNSDMTFRWKQGVEVDRFEKELTKIFDYEEKADYVSIFIEYEDENPPVEIAAMVNGVCKGASVYEGEMTEILTYLDEEDLNQEVELVFAYDAKKPVQLMNDFAIINPHNQNPEYVPLIARAGTPYYHIKFNKQKDDEITAPVIQLQQNYPNPFNPETNINFYLSKDDNIKLSIYNVKGQKVRDLYSGYKQAGKHTIVWDGKDSMNKSVSSGIYLYKLNTRYGSIQRKMTLIK